MLGIFRGNTGLTLFTARRRVALHMQKKPNLGLFIFGQAQTHFKSN